MLLRGAWQRRHRFRVAWLFEMPEGCLPDLGRVLKVLSKVGGAFLRQACLRSAVCRGVRTTVGLSQA
eukprot:11183061-Lingulodinium_polyedra.AAC.1